MKYRDFIERIGQQADLTHNEALQATEATLETLGERMDRTERDLLAAQLPNELKEILRRRKQSNPYPLDEFYNRVRARRDTGYPETIREARVVGSVLAEAISPGELDAILSKLPAEYGELFGRSPVSPLSPTTEG